MAAQPTVSARRTAAHVFLSPIQHESRLLKEARSLLEAGVAQRILVLGIWHDGLAESEPAGPDIQIRRIRVKTRGMSKGLLAQAVKYAEWAWRTLRQLCDEKPVLIHAHGLSALPIALLAKAWCRAPVIYDAHELESEKSGLTVGRRKLSRITERALIRKADLSVVVSDSIADWYARTYGIARPLVVRNIPAASARRKGASPLRERCGVGSDEYLFLYIGMLSHGRSIERLCRVFERVGPDRHIVFMGYGPLEAAIRDYAARYPNIHFLDAVAPDEVGLYIRGADIGLCLIEEVSLSYTLSLPNKLFQCLAEGVPVLINELPEQARFVRELRCGWIAPADDAALRQLLDGLGRSEIAEARARADRAGRALSWESEIVPYLQYSREHALAAR